jgi:hypothetical protein
MKVKGIIEKGKTIFGFLDTISQNEISIICPEELTESSKYAWLDLELPGFHKHIKILGELEGKTGTGSLKFKFKHLFPNYRKLLSMYLSSTRV